MGLIAWDVLLPSGAIIPRYFKHHDPQWFYLHISIQIVGFLPGLATVVAGRTLYNGLESYRIPKFKIHRPLGSLVFFLGILQAGQDIQTAQVLELVTSLGRETCSHLGSSEYCDWTLSGRSRLGVEDRIWVSCDNRNPSFLSATNKVFGSGYNAHCLSRLKESLDYFISSNLVLKMGHLKSALDAKVRYQKEYVQDMV
ncbi:hypothetical protein VitviT2T_018699 [Vitis vinifera]|nr:hypothetical protein VitviT2T_018699 [Vitis vinifera]